MPAGHYFMMGDNRDDSADSRFSLDAEAASACLPLDYLVGRGADHLLLDRRLGRMAEALDLVHARRAGTGSGETYLMRRATSPPGSRRRSATGRATSALFERALTHASHGGDHYERLEFLGDRVLGLVDRRLALRDSSRTSPRASCRGGSTRWSRARPAPRSAASSASARRIRLGKQARDDGAARQRQCARRRRRGADRRALSRCRAGGGRRASSDAPGATRVSTRDKAPQASQVGASGMGRGARPQAARSTSSTGRSGPHHAPRFVVEVAIKGVGAASAEGAEQAGGRNRGRRRSCWSNCNEPDAAASSPSSARPMRASRPWSMRWSARRSRSSAPRRRPRAPG